MIRWRYSADPPSATSTPPSRHSSHAPTSRPCAPPRSATCAWPTSTCHPPAAGERSTWSVRPRAPVPAGPTVVPLTRTGSSSTEPGEQRGTSPLHRARRRARPPPARLPGRSRRTTLRRPDRSRRNAPRATLRDTPADGGRLPHLGPGPPSGPHRHRLRLAPGPAALDLRHAAVSPGSTPASPPLRSPSGPGTASTSSSASMRPASPARTKRPGVASRQCSSRPHRTPDTLSPPQSAKTSAPFRHEQPSNAGSRRTLPDRGEGPQTGVSAGQGPLARGGRSRIRTLVASRRRVCCTDW